MVGWSASSRPVDPGELLIIRRLPQMDSGAEKVEDGEQFCLGRSKRDVAVGSWRLLSEYAACVYVSVLVCVCVIVFKGLPEGAMLCTQPHIYITNHD